LLEEENIELLPDAELLRLREIDALTGVPKQGDILLHALPVCAPYSVLQGYKHKLKITPGSQRKGKAAKQASKLFSSPLKLLHQRMKLLRININSGVRSKVYSLFLFLQRCFFFLWQRVLWISPSCFLWQRIFS
jgi:hypothetical protein